MRVVEVDKTKCLICEVSSHQGLTFFQFPEQESSLKMWIKEISPLLDILKIQPNRLKDNGRICARHFREKDFTNRRRDALMPNACPSLSVSNLSVNFRKSKTDKNEVFREEVYAGISPFSASNENEKDIFQCGQCKAQFQILSEFADHKRFVCRSRIAESTKINSWQRHKAPKPGYLVPVENGLLLGSDQLLEMAECGSGNSEEIVNVARKERSGDEIISFVPNDKKTILGHPDDFASSPAKVLLTPHLPSRPDETVELNEADVVDLSFACQLIASPRIPRTNGSLLMKNGNDETQLDSFIVTADDGIHSNGAMVYSCPVASGDGVIAASSAAADQVVIASGIPDLSGRVVVDVDDAFTYCELTNSIRGSRDGCPLDLPRENGKGETETSRATEQNETEKTKTRLPCPYCGKVFEKPFNLQQHERVHTGERPFQCVVCGRAFAQKSNVRKHMKRHKVWPKGKQTLKLRVPGKDDDGESLDEIDYSCQYCPLSFKSYAEHKKHLAVHYDVKVYRCIQKSCDETFGDLDEFLLHSKTHSSVEFRCHICFEVFTNLEDLGVHQYDHDTTGRRKSKEIETKLKCRVCHARFKSAESLKNHLAVDTHRYECVRCKSIFCSERFLRRHLFIHLGSSKSKFECQNCKKTFRTQQNLRNHMFVHLEEKPFTCDHCDKQFSSKYRLKRHLAVHLDQFLGCPLKKHLGCEKTFYRKDKLRDHIGTHGHCKLRSCRTCSKTSLTLCGLRQRAKRDRETTNEVKEALECSACSWTFRKQNRSTRHDCTLGKRESKNRHERGREAVSNIEIIMVPFD